MHFSWKYIWMYRLALAGSLAFVFVLLFVTMNPVVLLRWLIEPVYAAFGSLGALLACTVALLAVWAVYFVLLATLREGLRQQHEARRLISPLHWYLGQLMAMSGTETVELIRRSGSLLSIRADGDTYFLSESSSYGLVAAIRVTPHEIVDASQPYGRLLPHVVEELRTDVTFQANRLRAEFG